MRISDRFLRFIVWVHDILMCLAAFVLANLIAFGPELIAFVPGIVEKAVAFVAISALFLHLMHVNQGFWRYASLSDLVAIAKAATATVAIFTVANFIVSRGENISRQAIVFSWIFFILFVSSSRIAYRMVKERYFYFDGFAGRPRQGAVLLYPLSSTTENFIRFARIGPQRRFFVAGVIGDDDRERGRLLHGVPVLGTLTDMGKIIEHGRAKGREISQLIVTDPTVTGAKLAAVVKAASGHHIDIVRTKNAVQPHDPHKAAADVMRPIAIEDLLSRPEYELQTERITHFLGGRTVLVSGAGGSIGSALCAQVAAFQPARMLLVEANEYNLVKIESALKADHPDIETVPLIADIRDRERLDSVLKAHRPEVVLHTAALKHVPVLEANPIEAVKTNFVGTVNLAEACIAHGADVFVLVSTDKAVNPVGVLGLTKRAAEIYCLALDRAAERTRFRTVRFGNVIGSSGSVVPLFRDQIDKGGPVTITHPDMTRYFMSIDEAVRLILNAASHGLRRGIDRGTLMVLDMGEPTRIVDLARRLIGLSGREPDVDVKIEFTGVRPGERFHEQLIGAEEHIASEEDGFFVVESTMREMDRLTALVAQIRAHCEREEAQEAVALVRKIVAC